MDKLPNFLASALSDPALVNAFVLFVGLVFVSVRAMRRSSRRPEPKAMVAALFEGVTVGAAVVLLFGVLLSFSDRLDITSFWRNNNFIIIIISMTTIIRAVETLFDRFDHFDK
jgi:hypothetical protein